MFTRDHRRQSLLEREQVFEVRPQFLQVVVQTLNVFVTFVNEKVQFCCLLNKIANLDKARILYWHLHVCSFELSTNVCFFVELLEHLIAVNIDCKKLKNDPCMHIYCARHSEST